MKRFIGALVLGVAMLSSASAAWAAECCMHGGQCPMQQRSMGMDEEKGHCPVTSKALQKAKFLLKNADAIGLSDEQVQAITAIKLDLKRTKIRQEAEMAVFELDIKAKMSEPKLDVEGLNAMFDTAGQGFVTGAKAVLAQYAKLKGTLSEEQMKKAKELWKKQQ